MMASSGQATHLCMNNRLIRKIEYFCAGKLGASMRNLLNIKIILAIWVVCVTSALFPQRRVVRDTLFANGKPVGYMITNWYCIEGDECPSFTVFDENGKKIVSEDLLGKTVVISF